MVVYEYVNLAGETVGVDNLDDNKDILTPEAIEVIDRGVKVMKMVKQDPTPKDTPIDMALVKKALAEVGFRNVAEEDVKFLASFTRFCLKAYVNTLSADPGAMFSDTKKKLAYYLNDWFGMQPVEWEQKSIAVDSGTVKDAEVYVGETLLTNGHYFTSGCVYPAPLADAVGYWRWTTD